MLFQVHQSNQFAYMRKQRFILNYAPNMKSNGYKNLTYRILHGSAMSSPYVISKPSRQPYPSYVFIGQLSIRDHKHPLQGV